MMRHAALVLALECCVLAAAGCGTHTSVTQVWQAPTVPSTPPMRTMLVFGVHTDESSRRILEDQVARSLASHGVKTAPSYSIFTGTLPPIDQARTMVNEKHFDGILVLRLQNVREETHYVPPSGRFWGGYYGGYGWGYSPMSPGYLITDEIVTFEATVWDLRADDRLVWSAQTKTTNPESGADFAQSLTRAVGPALVKARLLAPASDQD